VPELPEVETIRTQLAPRLEGRVLTRVEILDPRLTRPYDLFEVTEELEGDRVVAVERRGKYLLLRLESGLGLLVHLRMTGSFGFVPVTHERAIVELDDGTRLAYRDVRRFGRIAVVPAGVYDSLPTLHALGPEPLSDDFDPLAFHRALKASRRPVKTQLMSQRPVAGVGNIYADEALWRAGVHPGSRKTTRAQSDRIHAEVRAVLTDAIERRGTTLRDYRTFDREAGSNQTFLECYGRAGRPCLRCGTELRRRVIDARGTTWCPQCQRRR